MWNLDYYFSLLKNAFLFFVIQGIPSLPPVWLPANRRRHNKQWCNDVIISGLPPAGPTYTEPPSLSGLECWLPWQRVRANTASQSFKNKLMPNRRQWCQLQWCQLQCDVTFGCGFRYIWLYFIKCLHSASFPPHKAAFCGLRAAAAAWSSAAVLHLYLVLQVESSRYEADTFY